MLFRTLILPGVLLPALFAALAYGFSTSLARRSRATSGAGALALAAAFLTTFVALTGWPRWPPVEATQRLFFVVALAALIVWGFALRGRARLPWLLHAGLVALVLGLVLESQIENRWSVLQSIGWLVALLVLAMVVDWALVISFRGDGIRDGLLGILVRLAVVGGSAGVLGLSQSARLAQIAGGLACGMTVVEIAGWFERRRPWQPADAAVLNSALVGLLLAGYFYAGLTPLTAGLVLLAFLLLALPQERWWARLAPLLPLALALGIVVAAFLTEEDDPYGDYSALTLPAARAPSAEARWQRAWSPGSLPEGARLREGTRLPVVGVVSCVREASPSLQCI